MAVRQPHEGERPNGKATDSAKTNRSGKGEWERERAGRKRSRVKAEKQLPSTLCQPLLSGWQQARKAREREGNTHGSGRQGRSEIL